MNIVKHYKLEDAIFLKDILTRDKNNFDIIRLFSALVVIFGHSFYLFPTGGYQEPVTMVLKNNFSGTFSVGVFFFISGILVTKSFLSNQSTLRYIAFRLARIVPGIFVCITILAFIVGPAVSKLPISEYFFGYPLYCYWVQNSTVAWIVSFWNYCSSIPGAFDSNIFPNAPNGSLWTIRPEIVCYTYILFAGFLGLLKNSLRINISIALILITHFIWPHALPYFWDDVIYSDILKVGLFFTAGVFAYSIRNYLVIRFIYILPMVFIVSLIKNEEIREYFLYATFFYAVLVIAAWDKLLTFRLPGDYSFGVYIYGWPIQQCLNHFWPGITSLPSNLICLPLALLAGWLSWNLIERPFLIWIHNLINLRRPQKVNPP